jgi:hypothetical protein
MSLVWFCLFLQATLLSSDPQRSPISIWTSQVSDRLLFCIVTLHLTFGLKHSTFGAITNISSMSFLFKSCLDYF